MTYPRYNDMWRMERDSEIRAVAQETDRTALEEGFMDSARMGGEYVRTDMIDDIEETLKWLIHYIAKGDLESAESMIRNSVVRGDE